MSRVLADSNVTARCRPTSFLVTSDIALHSRRRAFELWADHNPPRQPPSGSARRASIATSFLHPPHFGGEEERRAKVCKSRVKTRLRQDVSSSFCHSHPLLVSPPSPLPAAPPSAQNIGRRIHFERKEDFEEFIQLAQPVEDWPTSPALLGTKNASEQEQEEEDGCRSPSPIEMGRMGEPSLCSSSSSVVLESSEEERRRASGYTSLMQSTLLKKRSASLSTDSRSSSRRESIAKEKFARLRDDEMSGLSDHEDSEGEKEKTEFRRLGSTEKGAETRRRPPVSSLFSPVSSAASHRISSTVHPDHYTIFIDSAVDDAEEEREGRVLSPRNATATRESQETRRNKISSFFSGIFNNSQGRQTQESASSFSSSSDDEDCFPDDDATRNSLQVTSHQPSTPPHSSLNLLLSFPPNRSLLVDRAPHNHNSSTPNNNHYNNNNNSSQSVNSRRLSSGSFLSSASVLQRLSPPSPSTFCQLPFKSSSAATTVYHPNHSSSNNTQIAHPSFSDAAQSPHIRAPSINSFPVEWRSQGDTHTNNTSNNNSVKQNNSQNKPRVVYNPPPVFMPPPFNLLPRAPPSPSVSSHPSSYLPNGTPPNGSVFAASTGGVSPRTPSHQNLKPPTPPPVSFVKPLGAASRDTSHDQMHEGDETRHDNPFLLGSKIAGGKQRTIQAMRPSALEAGGVFEGE
eukprot:GDKJ01026313.1.p1 GENE.GDKJ01026313.1~~GDKJ01026313.1.p1  ORF type:complete len:683 (-),score=201.14 GDKJ01026313.1:26-2074(-)